VEYGAKRLCFSFPTDFKTYANLLEAGEPGDAQPIINEWGEVWVVPSKVGEVSEPNHG
jgi:hypothetical protein